MKTTEHLQKIKAKCQELLATTHKMYSPEQAANDIDFIASCAGNAEAGWRATIAAIDDWLGLYVYTDGFADGAPDASPHDKLCNEIASMARRSLNHIITAWPEEML